MNSKPINIFLLLLAGGMFASCTPQHSFTYQARKQRLSEKIAISSGPSVSTGNTTSPPRASTISSFERVIAKAKTYLGTPHVLGGNGYEGIDCSGLMVASFSEAGISLPRTADGQAKMGIPVSIEKLKEGDLVFFSNPNEGKIVHVGVVSKVNQPKDITFIHASTSKGVREDKLFSNYWLGIYTKARRIL